MVEPVDTTTESVIHKVHFHIISKSYAICDLRTHANSIHTLKACSHEFLLFLNQPVKSISLSWRETGDLAPWTKSYLECTLYNMAAFRRIRHLLLLLIRRRHTEERWSIEKVLSSPHSFTEETNKESYANLIIREMQLGDHESFFKYFRLSPTVFGRLLC